MKLLALLALVSLGCGGSSGSGQCQPRQSGNYQIDVTPLSPNGCQLEPGTLVSTGATPFADCLGTEDTSADMCSWSLDKMCGTSHVAGTIDWNATGTRGDGLATWHGVAPECTSTVMLVISKL
jgi:hypothetical protein